MSTNRFDWVKARVECNAYKLFMGLRETVHSDCDRARELSDKNKALEGILFENDHPNVFYVTRENSARIFRLSQDKITVSDKDGKILFSALPLQQGMLCYLETDEGNFLPWEFSRRVLEDFFFEK